MAGYIGNATGQKTGSYTVDEFTSVGGSTYTFSKTPGAKNNIQVSVGGLTQAPSAYSISGTTLTIAGVTSGQKIIVRHMGDTITYPLLDDNAVTNAKIVSMDATKLTGSVPSSALTNVDLSKLEYNQAILAFKIASSNQLAKFSMVDQVIDEYQDTTGIDAGASTNERTAGSGTAKYYDGAATTSVTASGGTITTDGDYTIHSFTATGSSTFTTDTAQDVDYLVVAGGAGAGGQRSGGGGAGGFLTATGFGVTATSYSITVGAGGAGGSTAGSAAGQGTNGGNSVFSSFTSIGGGGGGGGMNAGAHNNGKTGGSGGGGGTNGGSGGAGTASQGNAGGAVSGTHGGAGGGGASVVGVSTTSINGGNGGAGIASTITGSSLYYAGGGGGGSDGATAGTGGSSVGGAGTNSSAVGAVGTVNTGSGGGGSATGYGGAGGSGVVIIRRPTAIVVAGGNLTLQSTATTAETTPTTADLVVLIEDGSGTATVNTDVKGYISRNGSAFSTAVTFVDEGDWGTNKRILVARNVDISGITTGTAMKYKLTTHNQSAGSKETRIHATSLAWA